MAHQDGATSHCVPVVEAVAPVVRFTDTRDDGTGPWPYPFAVFPADNAVITALTPSDAEMDRKLPELMSELDAE